VTTPPPGHAVSEEGETHTRNNRFLLSSVAFLRSKQLSNGARARVERKGHKPTFLAVFEVLANTVSWSRV